METIKDINDFKKFMEMNRERIYANAVSVEELPKDDEWLNDEKWDVIYKDREKKSGNI